MPTNKQVDVFFTAWFALAVAAYDAGKELPLKEAQDFFDAVVNDERERAARIVQDYIPNKNYISSLRKDGHEVQADIHQATQYRLQDCKKKILN